MELLRIENLSFAYPGRPQKALDSLSFHINAGDFVVLCGPSGCGKSTLLRLIKREIAPKGEMSGNIFFGGKEQSALTAREAAAEIGFVAQNPETQIVTDKVWHELSFALENLGYDRAAIGLRVGELANYFGIASWFRRETHTLSGGQKQLLNLASVMTVSPKLLLLDEPTSQLDPIAASEFIGTLRKINRELGITVLLAEHRLEELFPIADKVAVLDGGRLVAFDKPREVCAALTGSPVSAGFPSAARIWQALGGTGDCPLTVREGRSYLESQFAPAALPLEASCDAKKSVAVRMDGVWFRYGKEEADVLCGTSVEIREGEIFSILGGNASGKSTALRLIAGLRRAYRGKIEILGKNIAKYSREDLHRNLVALLPQDPKTLFVRDTVREDLEDIFRSTGGNKIENAVIDVCDRLGISGLLDRHPYDLSGGEQQKCALAKVLLTNPKILLLDEPTKGIDAYAKLGLAEIVRKLKADGVTVILVTHDVEFAAAVSDRAALLFNGELLAPSSPRKFFGSNNFYTTAASRMSRGLFANAVTVQDVVALGEESRK